MTVPRFDFDDRPDARYCPSCGGAFRPDIDRCPRCEEALVVRAEAERLAGVSPVGAARSSPPGPGVVPGDGPDVVAARLDRALVEPVCGALDEEGIRYRLEDHLVPQFGLGAATFGVILWVAESQAPAAREIVDDVSAGLSLTDETTGTPDVAAGEGPEAGRGDRPRRDEDDSEEGDADDHRLSRRAISVRLARWTLLGLAAWSSVWAALGWSAGYRGPAVVLLVFAVPPLVLWWISRRAPRGAFTAAAILGAGLLVLEVVTGLVVPDARAEPGLVFGTAFFVVSMVWVVQRLSRARR